MNIKHAVYGREGGRVATVFLQAEVGTLSQEQLEPVCYKDRAETRLHAVPLLT